VALSFVILEKMDRGGGQPLHEKQQVSFEIVIFDLVSNVAIYLDISSELVLNIRGAIV
jgi:hypothetical protein